MVEDVSVGATEEVTGQGVVALAVVGVVEDGKAARAEYAAGLDRGRKIDDLGGRGDGGDVEGDMVVVLLKRPAQSGRRSFIGKYSRRVLWWGGDDGEQVH